MGSQSDEEKTTPTQEEIDDLLEKLSNNKIKYQNLKKANNTLQERNTELIEKNKEGEIQKMQIESSLAKMANEMKEKEKEIATLKTAQKEPINSKIFKALAEESQNLKSKTLTLNKELKEKEKEIETLKSSIEKYLSLELDLQMEKSKSSKLMLELDKIKTQQNSSEELQNCQILANNLSKEIEKLKEELTIKEKEIENFKRNSEPQRTMGNSDKMFKALAQEAQAEKSRAVTLLRQVESLKEILLKKDEEIEQLTRKFSSRNEGET